MHSLTTVTHTTAQLLHPVALGEEICNLFGKRQHGFQVGMKHGVAEEQKSCVFRFWASTCTHTPRSFRDHYKQQGPGVSFIYTQEEWVWNGFQDIPVCCRMSSMKRWLHVHTTHPFPVHTLCTYKGVFWAFSHKCKSWEDYARAPMWPTGYLFKRTRNLSMGCEDLWSLTLNTA